MQSRAAASVENKMLLCSTKVLRVSEENVRKIEESFECNPQQVNT